MQVCCCVKTFRKSTLSIGKRLLAIEKTVIVTTRDLAYKCKQNIFIMSYFKKDGKIEHHGCLTSMSVTLFTTKKTTRRHYLDHIIRHYLIFEKINTFIMQEAKDGRQRHGSKCMSLVKRANKTEQGTVRVGDEGMRRGLSAAELWALLIKNKTKQTNLNYL